MAQFLFEGRKVYYEVHGDKGEPLLILNGIMMSTASMYENSAAFAALTLGFTNLRDEGISMHMVR